MTITTKQTSASKLEKAPTGIDGFDEMTAGGLPKGRPTLVCGSAGCGKTLFSMEFLVRGAMKFGEPGVFMAFEESREDLAKNVASLGFDLEDLIDRGLMAVDHVRVERSEIEEAGDYDLEGLFIRLGFAIDRIGAKRVVLDTIETLFSGLSNPAVLRSELRRLFQWLRSKGVTAIITGERGEGQLTRQGLEEYVSDCVVLLDHRVTKQVSTRRIRVVKYRGSVHGTNEYPFLIGENGITVLPVTSMGLQHAVSDERVSSGVKGLDEMLEGKGLYRGSSVLISGTAGTGKSSLCSHFANAACSRGERCLYFAFEESPLQIARNMASIGLQLKLWMDAGLLKIHATRPNHYGLETHLATMHRLIETFSPSSVIVDPVSNLTSMGDAEEVNAMLLRLVDFLKTRGVTAMFTTLTTGGHALEQTEIGLSSLMDAWILLRDIELSGERNRGIYVLKARGMAHSNQIREFLLTKSGIELKDVYLGPAGVLTGSARVAQEEQERVDEVLYEAELEKRRLLAERRRKTLASQIAALEAELEAEEHEIRHAEDLRLAKLARAGQARLDMARSRRAVVGPLAPSNGRTGAAEY